MPITFDPPFIADLLSIFNKMNHSSIKKRWKNYRNKGIRFSAILSKVAVKRFLLNWIVLFAASYWKDYSGLNGNIVDYPSENKYKKEINQSIKYEYIPLDPSPKQTVKFTGRFFVTRTDGTPDRYYLSCYLLLPAVVLNDGNLSGAVFQRTDTHEVNSITLLAPAPTPASTP